MHIVLIFCLLILKVCVSPIKIPNPNYRSKVDLIRKTTDTESSYIYVPCGHCNECIMKRQSDLVQRVRALSLDHYIYFCTLTYNEESLPKVTTSNGVTISYADYRDVYLMIKRIRKDKVFNRGFLYFFTSERGKKGHRPHFHGLFFFKRLPDDDFLLPAQIESTLKDSLLKEWRRNYGSTRNPIWRPLFSFRSKFVAGRKFSNFDCHYVVPYTTEKGSDDVAFYVSKYCLKTSEYETKLQQALRLNLEPSVYREIWNLVKSRSFFSKGFGYSTDKEIEYVKDSILRSKDDPDGLKFFHSDGSSSPLARCYRRFLSADAAIDSVTARGGPLSINDREFDLKVRSQTKGDIIRTKVKERDIIDLIPI